jgi:hypothetical protein
MVARQEKREQYWHLPEDERKIVWIKVISQGLGITEDEARKRLERNNKLPIKENEKIYSVEDFKDGTRSVLFTGEDSVVVYPRFNANAVLLAQVSPHYEGPRGPRPSLASASNILRISDLPKTQTITYGVELRQNAGGISKLLLELKLSASNPGRVPEGVEFSNEDIRHGIYIPRAIDKPTSRALGVAYGNGNLSGGAQLLLSAQIENREFYKGPVRQVFEEAFNGYESLYLTYGSKALSTYLLNYHGFPKSRDERRKTGISESLKNIRGEFQDEFLKYYLAAAVVFNREDALVRISDVSKPLLRDVEAMIKTRVTKDSISFRKGVMGENYLLSLSTIPSMELYVRGFLNVNPRIREEAERYWNEKLGGRAAKYLERTYGKRPV